MFSMPFLYGFLIAAASLAVVYGIFKLAGVVRVYGKFRGRRLVSCPEDRCSAAVRVAAGDAAAESLGGQPRLHLKACSHWPERAGCAQECLAQIENDPQGCLVWNQVQQWYRGRSCAYCRQPIDKIEWHDHRPAVVGPDQKTLQWDEIPAEKLPQVFQTCLPVCWSCHMAETFRREHPDKVVDRAADPERMSLYH
jgi:hypothetical protein